MQSNASLLVLKVWVHEHEDLKLRQFGWRCTNSENNFSDVTLVGNYNEERFDINHAKKERVLPSAVNIKIAKTVLLRFC